VCDFLILLKSESTAQRVTEGIVRYLEENLSLPLNKDKTELARIKGVPFLGFQILQGKIRVNNKARIKFKDRLRKLTRRNSPVSMYQITHDLNEYLRGWVSYFGIQEFRYLLRDSDSWIRGRLKSIQLKKWKKPTKFQRMMIYSGFKPQEAHRVWIKMNIWQSVERKEVRFIMNLTWFRKQGLIFLHDFTQQTLELQLFSR